MTNQLSILHITQCAGGGVPRAIVSLAEATATHNHHVLWPTSNDNTDVFKSVFDYPESIFRVKYAIEQAIGEIQPDIVHAHSSWAGFLTRFLPISVPVVYQPHCFGFEDHSRNRVSRILIRSVETLLSYRSSGTIALTQHEGETGKRISRKVPTWIVPNRASISSPQTGSDRIRSRSVVMAGRISPQKDPYYFAQVALLVSQIDPTISFRWLGDGDKALAKELAAAGVEISGWLTDTEIEREFTKAGVYFHSARYEGFPLSVLDAATMRLPIVVRDIMAFEGSGLEMTTSVDSSARAILLAFADPGYRERIDRSTIALLDSMNLKKQSASLNLAYSEILEHSIFR